MVKLTVDKNRDNLLVILLLFSIVFSPIFRIGVFFRIDQIIFVFLSIILIKKNNIKIPKVINLFVYFAISISLLSFVNLIIFRNINFYFLLNWPLKIIFLSFNIIVFLQFLNDKSTVYFKFLKAIYIVIILLSFVSIIQVVEFHNFIPEIGINKILSSFYPYQGSFTSEVLAKTKGYHLKMGGIGRATATFDGHPILYGDFLVFGLLIILPLVNTFKRVQMYFLGVISLFLTLSRGSIISWFAGITLYLSIIIIYFIIRKKININRFIKIFISILIVTVLSGLTIYYTNIGKTILWRIESTIDTFKGVGVSDPRTSRVWPNLIKSMDNNFLFLIFGIKGGYDKPTDSQYFWLIANVGISGLFFFFLIHIKILFLSIRSFLVSLTQNMKLDLYDLSFICAIFSLLVLYIVHPALQGDRLFTIIILAVSLYNYKSKNGDYKQ